MRYLAIGDSFTEGVGDVLPDGSVRGWADLVGAGLAASTGSVVQYANLAVRGRLVTPIMTEQVDAALAMDPPPTLVTLNGGGNDLLRPGMSPQRIIDLTEQATTRLADAGVRVALLCGPDPSGGLPLSNLVHNRAELLTSRVHDLGQRLGTTVIDVFHDEEIRRGGYWSPDRLHLNAAGHHRVAALVLAGLGHHDVTEVLMPDPEPRRGPLSEARYYVQHVGPWVGRRLRRRSSGDGRSAKYPGWIDVEPGILAS
ncbi:SGNH/GDSL hydrolase family protein [Kineosporia sp. J2-2]|uniref:SGNH/GDSL hydrolase family protein n=1 Tax=Kineosporia corallincola TaxID=2835133 RepID=A0ABS5TSC2_9ACTN|nr:SGNH/GDSL hydrolase family protein [Kineosporia corallincola]MBT0773712.1 SGNH/GDSL hydrolase family protein [Kineosporia corallincola]